MRIILSFILLLFAPFTPTIFGQQSTPAGNPSTPAASQQTYEVKIEFNRRVRVRDGTELCQSLADNSAVCQLCPPH